MIKRTSFDSSGRKSDEAAVVTFVAHPAERWRPRATVNAQAGQGCCCCCCLHTLGGLLGAAVAPLFGGRPKPYTVGGQPRPLKYLKAMEEWDKTLGGKAPSLPEIEADTTQDAIRSETPIRLLKPSEEKPELALPPDGDKVGVRAEPSLHNRDAITDLASSASEQSTESMRISEPNRDLALPPNGVSAVKIFWSSLVLLVLPSWLLFVGVLDPGAQELSGSFIPFVLMLLPGVQLVAWIVTLLILASSAPHPDKPYQYMQACKIFVGTVLGAGIGIWIMFSL